MSTKSHRSHLDKLVPALAFGAVVALSAGSASAEVVMSVGPAVYRACPSLIGGDDEFNGNGPDVDAYVTLYRDGGEKVKVDVYMHAMETRSDWTEGEIRKSYTLGSAPTGRPITQIWAPGPNGAFQWTVLGSAPTYQTVDVAYLDTDTTLDRFYNPQWWVSEIAVNGDTAGGDVGGCSADDTYMTVRLPKIWFLYK